MDLSYVFLMHTYLNLNGDGLFNIDWWGPIMFNNHIIGTFFVIAFAYHGILSSLHQLTNRSADVTRLKAQINASA